MKIHKELGSGGFPSPLSHRQVPACPGGNSSSPRCQGSLVSHPHHIPDFSGNRDNEKHQTRDSHSESCPALRKPSPALCHFPALGDLPGTSRGDKPPDFLTPQVFPAPVPRALPATWCFPSVSLGENEERAPVPGKGLRFSTSSQSAGAAALSSKEKVFPMPLLSWNQQHRECLRGAE